jgi:DNA-binding transcriptional LysR family regulator
MDIRLIKAFCAVYEEGSINRAALRLRVAQPSISVSVRSLEVDLRTTLFERSAAGTTPTPKAHALYIRLSKILADIEVARKSALGELQDFSGPLRVGLPPVLIKGILPGFLPQFLADHPNLSVRIAEGLPQRLTDLTLAGEIDFAVVTSPPIDGRLVGRRIAAEPFLLISSVGNPIIPRGPVDLTALPPFKLALPWARNSLRNTLDRFIDSNSLPVSHTIDMDTTHSILDLVRLSEWLSLLPVTSVMGEFERFTLRPITHPGMLAEYFVINSAQGVLPASAHSFIEEIVKGFAISAQAWSLHSNTQS